MTLLTEDELRFLTQKQIKEYVAIKYPDVVIPKKWTDKKSALAFVAKLVISKPLIEKVAKKRTANDRREFILKLIRNADFQSSSKSLAEDLEVTAKQITNDIFAIRKSDLLSQDEEIVKEKSIYKIKCTNSES